MPCRLKLLVAAFLLACLPLPSARAQLGQVDATRIAPSFPLDKVKKSVFCIREAGRKGFDQNCATASLIHSSGLIATAAHVVSGHGDRDFEIATAGGKTFRVQTVWISPSYNQNSPFLRDPQKLMMAEARMRFSAEGFRQTPVFDEIDPGVFSRADLALLRVVAEDLPALLATGAEPLAIRSAPPLASGEILLLAGFTWTHYAQGYLDSLGQSLGMSLKNTDGGFSVLAGRYYGTQGKLLLTRATPAQEKGEDLNTDAIDSFSGSSGAPVLDTEGRIVAFHSASDSSLGQFSRIRKSMVQIATAAEHLGEGLKSLGAK